MYVLNSDSTAALSGVEMQVPGVNVFVDQFTQGRLKSPIIRMVLGLHLFIKVLILSMHSRKQWRGA